MNGISTDKYIIFSAAAVAIVMLVCAVGSFNADGVEGNGMKEMEGIISEPSLTQNGTVFKVTDVNGNEYRCFYNSSMPPMQSLCRLVGTFSSDGNMFFVDRITVSGVW